MRIRLLLPAGIAFLAAASLVPADITVSGHITENTTWTAANSPYLVSDTVWVDSGVTLTIKPGVDVLFTTDRQIRVDGSVVAHGTAMDSIRFLPVSAVDHWDGLEFGGGDSSSLAYVRVSGVVKAGGDGERNGGAILIKDDGTRLGMSNSVISGNTALGRLLWGCPEGFETGRGAGILMLDSSFVTLDGCTISGNTATADYAKATKTDCGGEPLPPVGGGIYADGGAGHLSIRRTLIVDNHEGWDEGVPSAVWSARSMTLENCTIVGNVVTASAGFALNTIVVGDVNEFEGFEFRYSLGNEVPSGTGNLVDYPDFIGRPVGDFRLQSGSPAIDAGDPSMTDPDGTRIDIGALPYEQQSPTSVDESLPERVSLSAFPNPFNPATTIQYALPEAGLVRLNVFDVNGRLVRTLAAEHVGAGDHEIVWNGVDNAGRAVGSGVYVVRLITPGATRMTRVTLVR